MPISMLKTYDTDWKRNGQGIHVDGTLQTLLFFAYSRAINPDHLFKSDQT